MKRKAFIIASATVGIGLPAVYYLKKNKWGNFNPLTTPVLLSTFCSEMALRDIGQAYIKQVPAENTKQALTDIILTDGAGKKIKAADKSSVSSLIEEKIHDDFAKHNILILNQWIISITEARQCALFSLT